MVKRTSKSARAMKIQPAIEYLSSFAVALIILGVVIAAAALYLLSHNGSTLTPSTCYISPELDCAQMIITNGGTGAAKAIVTFTNGLSTQMNFPQNSFVIYAGLATTAGIGTCLPVNAVPGALVTCNATINSYSPQVGSQVSSRIQLIYQQCVSTNPHCQTYNTSGSASTYVASPASLFRIQLLTSTGTGNVSLDGVLYTSSTNVIFVKGEQYSVVGVPPSYYTFKNWNPGGGANIKNSSAQSTTANATNNGTITAVFQAGPQTEIPTVSISLQSGVTAQSGIDYANGTTSNTFDYVQIYYCGTPSITSNCNSAGGSLGTQAKAEESYNAGQLPVGIYQLQACDTTYSPTVCSTNTILQVLPAYNLVMGSFVTDLSAPTNSSFVILSPGTQGEQQNQPVLISSSTNLPKGETYWFNGWNGICSGGTRFCPTGNYFTGTGNPQSIIMFSNITEIANYTAYFSVFMNVVCEQSAGYTGCGSTTLSPNNTYPHIPSTTPGPYFPGTSITISETDLKPSYFAFDYWWSNSTGGIGSVNKRRGSQYTFSMPQNPVNETAYFYPLLNTTPACSTSESGPFSQSVQMSLDQNLYCEQTATGGPSPFNYGWGWPSSQWSLVSCNWKTQTPSGSTGCQNPEFSPNNIGSYTFSAGVTDNYGTSIYNNSGPVSVTVVPSLTVKVRCYTNSSKDEETDQLTAGGSPIYCEGQTTGGNGGNTFSWSCTSNCGGSNGVAIPASGHTCPATGANAGQCYISVPNQNAAQGTAVINVSVTDNEGEVAYRSLTLYIEQPLSLNAGCFYNGGAGSGLTDTLYSQDAGYGFPPYVINCYGFPSGGTGSGTYTYQWTCNSCGTKTGGLQMPTTGATCPGGPNGDYPGGATDAENGAECQIAAADGVGNQPPPWSPNPSASVTLTVTDQDQHSASIVLNLNVYQCYKAASKSIPSSGGTVTVSGNPAGCAQSTGATITQLSNSYSSTGTSVRGFYPYDNNVQFTANPGSGYTFAGWGGTIASGSNPVTVAMPSGGALYENASFNLIQTSTTTTGSGELPAACPNPSGVASVQVVCLVHCELVQGTYTNCQPVNGETTNNEGVSIYSDCAAMPTTQSQANSDCSSLTSGSQPYGEISTAADGDLQADAGQAYTVFNSGDGGLFSGVSALICFNNNNEDANGYCEMAGYLCAVGNSNCNPSNPDSQGGTN